MDLDFVTAWKASSVVLAGAFGILGLVKEFKDKQSGHITKWGRISLAGILLSSGFGVIAQLKESSDKEASRKATADQTLTLAQKTDQAVRDIQRVLSPFDEPRISCAFEISCNDPKYKAYCLSVKGMGFLEEHLAKWPGGSFSVLTFQLFFFVDPRGAQNFIDGMSSQPDFWIDVCPECSNKDQSLQVYHVGDNLGVALYEYTPHPDRHPSGRIKSLLDLSGVTMVIYARDNKLSEMTLKSFEIKFKSGETVYARPDGFEKIAVKDPIAKDITAYRYVFP
jgi:predicted outer membrane lipoprotein